MVKYKQDEFQEEDFITFWQSHLDGSGNDGFEIQIEDMLIQYPDGYYFNYKGYLKIEGYVGIFDVGEVQIDGKDYLNHETGDFKFEGYVSERISFYTSNTQVVFTEFSTIPCAYSEDVNIAYATRSGFKDEIYGELNINEVYQQGYFHWYNPDDDVETQRMRISVPYYEAEHNPYIGLSTSADYVTTAIEYSEIDSIETNTSVKNSGLYNLKYNPSSVLGALTSLPILIHKDDVGIKNTIGPFVKKDGSKVTIKLTII